MKKILMALIATASVNAFSQDIYLDQTDVVLGGSGATLIKTDVTPSNVTLRVTIPTTIERCNSNDYITVTGGTRCGYDKIPRYCRGGSYGGGYGIPTRRGPNYNPSRGGGYTPRRGTSIPAGRRYNPNHANGRGGFGGYYGGSYGGTYGGTMTCGYDSIPRTCSVCANPYYETVQIQKAFNLTFDRFTKDATIQFSLDQYGNLVLDVTGVSPGCVKKTIYGSGKNITGAKIKLKRSCR